jgi:hypothetical protein
MFGQGDGNINNVDWHSEDIEVSIKDSHDDASHRGKTGIIKTISGHVSSVWVPDLDQVKKHIFLGTNLFKDCFCWKRQSLANPAAKESQGQSVARRRSRPHWRAYLYRWQ